MISRLAVIFSPLHFYAAHSHASKSNQTFVMFIDIKSETPKSRHYDID